MKFEMNSKNDQRAADGFCKDWKLLSILRLLCKIKNLDFATLIT